VVQHILRRPLLDNPPFPDHHHAVGDGAHHAQVVGDEQQGHALALQLLEQRQDRRLHRHVQGRGHLVADQHRRLAHQRAGNRHALALATRQMMRVFVRRIRGQRDPCQRRVDTRPAGRALEAEEVLQGRLQALRHGLARVQGAIRVLEDVLDTVARDRRPLARQ